ncbi:MAG: cation:proton antiporter [Candidatus Nanohaloarchaea archaeon]
MAGISTSILFNLAVLLSASFIVGELFERIGLESIIGYIVTGLLLGPDLLDLVQPEAMAGFGTIGATLILFQAGLREENVADIFRHEEGLDLGLAVLIAPFIFILATLLVLGPRFLPYTGLQEFVFIALAYAVVDIGVPSKLMLSKNLLEEETGKYTIKSSVINVTAGLAVLTVLVMLSSSTIGSVMAKAGGILGFTLLFFLLHEFVHRLDDYIIMFEEVEAEFAITFALLLFMAYLTELVGLSSVLGAFFAGIIVSRSDFSDSRAFQEKINAIGEGLFIPLFFAWFGLGLKLFGDAGMIANIEAAFFLFALSTVSKFGTGYLVTRNHGKDKPFMISSSLLSLDIETLVILLIGIDLGVFGSEILQIFAPSVLFSTITIVLLYSLLERTGRA